MIQLNLSFKGGRTYLQGGDIFNAVVAVLKPELQGYLARLAFRQLARRQCLLHTQLPAAHGPLVATGNWCTGEGVSRTFWLTEMDAPVDESRPFDEESISGPAEVVGELIRGEAGNDYTLIENIIALTKKLNYRLAPDVDGKWLFGQIDLRAALPEQWSSLTIERKSAVGAKFSRNAIVIDGHGYGEIRFIGGRP